MFMSQSVLGQSVTHPWQQRSLAHMLQARVAATPELPAYREFAGKDQPWTQLS